MTLATQIADDIGTVFQNTDEFGVTVEYHPVGGGGKRTIVAGLHKSPSATFDKEQYHEVRRETVTLLFKQSDTDGITEAKRGDFITYLNEKWDFLRAVQRGTAVTKYLLIQWQQSKVINSGRVNIGV